MSATGTEPMVSPEVINKHMNVFNSIQHMETVIEKLEYLIAKINGTPISDGCTEKGHDDISLQEFLVRAPEIIETNIKLSSEMIEEIQTILF